VSSCERAPLCEQALATNRELRAEIVKLRATPARRRIAALERELRERDASPWAFLPWKGYVS
jgi:hypothetical protein